MMTRAEIEAVVGRLPLLQADGVGVMDGARRLGREERKAAMAADRERLLRDVDGCTRAEGWLRDKARIDTPRWSSDWIKHVAEQEVESITNGALIAAAVYLGFADKVMSGHSNVLIGIAKRELKPAI
jgi:hypothetical protein